MNCLSTSRQFSTSLVFYCLLVLLLWALSSPVYSHKPEDDKRAILDHLLEQQPNAQTLYIQRGQSWSEDGEYDKAAADFDRAIALGKADEVAFAYGQLSYRRGQFDTALAYFNRYLRLYPHHLPSLIYRARIQRDAERYAAALSDYEMLFKLQPQTAPGHYSAAANMALKLQRPLNALQILDRGMAELGVLVQLQNSAIEIEQQRTCYSCAIDRLETLRPQLGKSPHWKVRLATLLAKAGRQAEAKAYLINAQQQLEDLRSTVSRRKLQKTIEQLLQSPLLQKSPEK